MARTRTRVLALDFMGTICSPKQPIHLQYDHVARMLGIAVDPLLIRSSFKRSFKEVSKRHPLYGKLSSPPLTPDQWWSTLITETFLGAGYPSIDLAQNEQQLTATLIRRFQSSEGYFIHSDVPPLLRSLPSHVRPIVVSGSDRGIVHVLRDVGALGDRLKEEDVWTTWDLEKSKSDPAFWEAVLGRLNEGEGVEVKAEECLVVGDELLSDYETPRRIGMRSLLLQRPEAAGEPARVSYEDETSGAEKGLEVVQSLAEVAELLKGG